MKKYILLFLLLATSNMTWAQKNKKLTPKSEIIYHVCQRSFYDSNGDLNGDLDPFDQEQKWNDRPTWQKAVLIIHLGLVAAMFGFGIGLNDK